MLLLFSLWLGAAAAAAAFDPALGSRRAVLCAATGRSPHTRPTMEAVRRTEVPIWDGKPYAAVVVPATARRAALVTGGSSLVLALTLPQVPEFWSSSAALDAAGRTLESAGPSLRPLLTMLSMGGLTAAGWRAFGVDMHPITAKARGLVPPPAYAFQALGLGGAMLGAAAVATGWYPLPVAGSWVELAHCALPVALWQIDVRLLRFLNPQAYRHTGTQAYRVQAYRP